MIAKNWNRKIENQETQKVTLSLRVSLLDRANIIIKYKKDDFDEFKFANLTHFIELAISEFIKKEGVEE